MKGEKGKYLLLLLVLLIGISSRFLHIDAQGILVDETWVAPSTFAGFGGEDIFPKLFTYPQFLSLDPGRQEFIRHIYTLHPVFQIAALHAVSDLHPPLFFFLNYFWSEWFGYGLAAIRTPAAIYSILTLVLLWFILNRQKVDRLAAAFILCLVSISPIYLFFSNFARPYTLLLLFALLSSYLCYELVRNRFSKKLMAAYLLTAVACLYTHYYGVLVVASQIFYLLFESFRVRDMGWIGKTLLLGLLLAAAFSPLFLILALKARHSTPPAAQPFAYLSLTKLWELALSFGMAYSRSTLYSPLNILTSTILLLSAGAGAWLLWKNRRERHVFFWLFFLGCPLLLIALLNTLRPIFTVRNCLIVLIPYLAICGYGLAAIPWKWVRSSFVVLLGGVGLFYGFHGLTYGNVEGEDAFEDWKSTAEFVKTLDPQIPVYVYDASYRDPLFYYIRDKNRIRGLDTREAKNGPEEKTIFLVLMKPESKAMPLETKIKRETPFLLEKGLWNTVFLKEFPHIYIYQAERKM